MIDTLTNCAMYRFVSLFLLVKPVLENGRFEVVYQGNSAVLTWPSPTGDYTRQVVEQWTTDDRQKRAVERECSKSPLCKEHTIPINIVSITIAVDHQRYNFILVLYDGDVPVATFQSNKREDKGIAQIKLISQSMIQLAF